MLVKNINVLRLWGFYWFSYNFFTSGHVMLHTVWDSRKSEVRHSEEADILRARWGTCSGLQWVQIPKSCWHSLGQYGQTGWGTEWSLGHRGLATPCSETDEPGDWSRAAPPATHRHIKLTWDQLLRSLKNKNEASVRATFQTQTGSVTKTTAVGETYAVDVELSDRPLR